VRWLHGDGGRSVTQPLQLSSAFSMLALAAVLVVLPSTVALAAAVVSVRHIGDWLLQLPLSSRWHWQLRLLLSPLSSTLAVAASAAAVTGTALCVGIGGLVLALAGWCWRLPLLSFRCDVARGFSLLATYSSCWQR